MRNCSKLASAFALGLVLMVMTVVGGCTPYAQYVTIGQDTSGPTDTDTGTTVVTDADGDGYDSTVDCNDNDPTVHPGATEVCDSKDNDCDGQVDEGLSCGSNNDADGDGYTSVASGGTDCDDTDPSVHPGATEICDDGIDNDCNGQVDTDDSACADSGLPIAEDLDWLRISGDTLGMSCGLDFEGGTDCDHIAVTGTGIDPTWSYNTSHRATYSSSTGFASYTFRDGLYRITMRTDGSDSDEATWAQYSPFCESTTGEASDACWQNADGSWSLCFQVDGGEFYKPSFSDCRSTE